MFAKSHKGNPYEQATVNWKLIVDSAKLFNSLPIPKCRDQSKVLISYKWHTSYFEDWGSSFSWNTGQSPVILHHVGTQKTTI